MVNKHQKQLKQLRREEREIQKKAAKDDVLRREGIHYAIDALQPLIFYALRKEFKFGSERIGRFAAELHKLICLLATKKVSVNALLADLEDEAGITYNEDKNEWYFPERKRRKK